MTLLREVRRIYARQHPVFLRDMSPLRIALTRPGSVDIALPVHRGLSDDALESAVEAHDGRRIGTA